MAGKSNKLKIKKLQINLTNRWLYTLIVFFSLIVIGVFVYAVTPNPGHDITQIVQPSGCSTNQFLKWTGSSWTCETVSDEVGIGGSGTANRIPRFTGATTIGNSVIYESAGDVGIGGDVSIDGDVDADAFIGDGSGLMNLVVRVQGATSCTSAKDGLLRYRSSYCSGDDIRSSSFDVCMRKGASSYGWSSVKTRTWADTSCDTDGCPPGQDYYECWYTAPPGCYSSTPAGCYYSCFLAGTEILMADGTYKNIEQVKEGEWVVSYDIENNLKTISKVAHSLVHEDVKGYVIINKELEVTSNHPMWIVNRQKWAQVHTIELRDILLDSNGQEIIVISLEDINGVNTVYNLEIEGEHNNYFAGDILVHNKLPDNGPPM